MKRLVGALVLASLSCGAMAATISTPPLSATVRDDNGAFDNVIWNVEFFRTGWYVSDYGFQLGSDTTTFTLFDASGSNASLVSGVTASGNTVTVTGTYAGDIGFTRTYSIPSGYDNVITVTTEVVNGGTSLIDLNIFDVFDPDQGYPLYNDYTTVNDVVDNPGGVANARGAVASKGNTVLLATQDDGAIGFGTGTSPFGLGFDDGLELNTFLSAPYDPDNANNDVGFAVAFTTTLAPGDSLGVSYDLVFGGTVAEVFDTYRALRGAPVTVPEPAGIALLGMGLLGLAARRRKRLPVC